MGTTRLFLTALIVQAAHTYNFFQDRIPNGDNVPHPCHLLRRWGGVGHLRSSGGGPRNPFGLDFHRVNKMWTKELCEMDSDGDGRTNGQELGDPDCVWQPGAFPTHTANLSHPGICEPMGSPQCSESNTDIDCSSEEFICDPIHNEDVFNVTLRLPPTTVPTSKFTYMCYTFILDMLEENVDYHLIATKPYIDNTNVLHHIQLNGCGPTAQPLEKPEECNMVGSGCQNYLAIWTLGMPGECVHKDAGFKINRNSIKWLTMQVHWTNPEGRDDYTDSSGLVLYLTKKLRKYNAGIWQTGQIHLNIPPGLPRHYAKSVCTSDCTRTQLPGPAYIMTAYNHMHYLGIGGNVAHFRDGVKIRDLTPDDVYDYNQPHIHRFDPPHEIRPGDVLDTTCVYRSSSRRSTTMFGESADDEMCLGVFTFFPAENILHDSCYTWKDFDICYGKNGAIHGCSYAMIFNPFDKTRQDLISKILDNCNFYGGCRPECPAAIAEVKQHPCFNDLTGPYMMDLLRALRPNIDLVKFLSAMQSCECPADGSKPPDHTGFPTAAAHMQLPVLLITFLIPVLTFLQTAI